MSHFAPSPCWQAWPDSCWQPLHDSSRCPFQSPLEVISMLPSAVAAPHSSYPFHYSPYGWITHYLKILWLNTMTTWVWLKDLSSVQGLVGMVHLCPVCHASGGAYVCPAETFTHDLSVCSGFLMTLPRLGCEGWHTEKGTERRTQREGTQGHWLPLRSKLRGLTAPFLPHAIDQSGNQPLSNFRGRELLPWLWVRGMSNT